MNEREVKNMITAFLKSGLNASQATGILKKAEQEAARARYQQEIQQFRSGLALRTVFAFVLLIIIFLCFVATQQPGF